ncbi:MAG: hypothetical protein ACTS2F_10580 [Thainema sp.]
MASKTINQRISQFAIATLFVAAISILLKILLTFLGEVYVYSIPILGGLLQSIEVVEICNFLIFAILGFGVGVATVFLPNRLRQRWGAIALVILIPIVISAGYMTRHHYWVRQVASEGQISVAEARSTTNDLLQAEMDQGGALGYFLYTIKVPLLPTDARSIQDLASSEQRLNREVVEISGMESKTVSLLFDLVGWCVRGFYLFIALMTACIYFYKGIGRVHSVRQQQQRVKAYSS